MRFPRRLRALLVCALLVLVAGFGWDFLAAKSDERRAVYNAHLVRSQAEQGVPSAETELGHLYFRGIGLPRDYSEAALWFHKAADHGDAKAQYSLGYMYWYGQGSTKDSGQAVQWWRKAADQGDPLAEDALGGSYFYGQGIQADWFIAASWYRKAADQGVADAQYRLGYMYYHGQGVAQDRTEARRLFQQSAAQGDDYARRALGYSRRRLIGLNEFTVFFIAVAALGGILLIVSALRDNSESKRRSRSLVIVAGALALASSGLDVYRHLYSTNPSSNLYTIVLLGQNLLGGVCVAMLLLTLFRNVAQLVLEAHCIVYIAFNLAIFTRFGIVLHQAPPLPILLVASVFFVGMASITTVSLWNRGRDKDVNDLQPDAQ